MQQDKILPRYSTQWKKEGLVSVNQSAQDKRVKEVFVTKKKDNSWQNKVKKESQDFRDKVLQE